MEVTVADAEGQFADLIRRAEAGDEVVLTRDGYPVVRFVPATAPRDRRGLDALVREIQASAAAKTTPGPSAARSQDFLYDEDGLPG